MSNIAVGDRFITIKTKDLSAFLLIKRIESLERFCDRRSEETYFKIHMKSGTIYTLYSQDFPEKEVDKIIDKMITIDRGL